MRHDGWWKIVNKLMRNGPSSWSIPRGCPLPSSPSCSSGCARRGPRDSLRATLIRMRHNIPQAVIGEQLGVCRPTISRAVKAMTDAIVRALKDVLFTAEEVPQGRDFRLDGTLFPCWSWRSHRELWSR